MRLHSDYIELVGVDVAVGVVADQSEVVENREEVMDETVGKNTLHTFTFQNCTTKLYLAALLQMIVFAGGAAGGEQGGEEVIIVE